ncbi:hypothetical protein RE428_48630 (plasmid) [Marinobacter nanhaiticus D15-8W]|uniref:Uncharacterized protein n=1 Tax=Marinobacter nanhaiticus D15-8W TaxID=626887 RepID=N6X7J2_9GAMM|nr:hypothetical protein [Marinobacter nanhaiticus]ENO17118.1 hypothetical protein J057_00594 [Marinobacter nanhaiticus D15-8W]BES73845.1 hypothetical protein RE428_48630 [Marinobacter nanhaiticus D15-8W]
MEFLEALKPKNVHDLMLIYMAVLLLPVWITVLRLRVFLAFEVAWKAVWGLFFTSTLFLAPFGIPRYVKAWKLALSKRAPAKPA